MYGLARSLSLLLITMQEIRQDADNFVLGILEYHHSTFYVFGDPNSD